MEKNGMKRYALFLLLLAAALLVAEAARAGDPQVLKVLVHRSCQYKAAVVAAGFAFFAAFFLAIELTP